MEMRTEWNVYWNTNYSHSVVPTGDNIIVNHIYEGADKKSSVTIDSEVYAFH